MSEETGGMYYTPKGFETELSPGMKKFMEDFNADCIQSLAFRVKTLELQMLTLSERLGKSIDPKDTD